MSFLRSVTVATKLKRFREEFYPATISARLIVHPNRYDKTNLFSFLRPSTDTTQIDDFRGKLNHVNREFLRIYISEEIIFI